MSFNFDIANEELDEEYADFASAQADHAADEPLDGDGRAAEPASSVKGREHTLDELIDALPARISYSTLQIPLDAQKGAKQARDEDKRRWTIVARRDLFDARFQMIYASDDEEEADGESRNGSAVPEGHEAGLVEADSDLVPGVYEGGLKTWECSLDLIAALDAHDRRDDGESSDTVPFHWLGGLSVVELGCGTAIPACFLLARLMCVEIDDARQETILQLCDFNEQVLKLVTLPNLILAWYTSPASSAFRASVAGASGESEGIELDLVPATGEVDLSDELLAAFKESLKHRKVALRFFSGPWKDLETCSRATSSQMAPSRAPQLLEADLLLSSETIYSPPDQTALLDILQRLCKASSTHNASVRALSEKLQTSGLQESSALDHSGLHVAAQPLTPRRNAEVLGTLALISAKVLYFGVGGGVHAFRQSIEKAGGWSHEVRKVTSGVGRCVLSIGWSADN
ncbi:Predicted methyltransferase [Ceraceosorus bombacis]|uniref:protein-histidine N-methyltransferase n=1 Tax=Ceraceosorus bombacis TaxID=401625 RepID=A0A0N7L8U7_9BASI|nr:Predicted methyltransferase [Ceraceosorus bombacis]